MSVSDNIQREVIKQMPINQNEVAEQFTSVFTLALSKFMDRLATGRIEITDFVDLQRVYTMWVEITQYKELAGGGEGGALPELRTTEVSALVESGVVSEDGETVDLTTKSEDDLEEMARKMMNAVNNGNAGEF